jgi:D-lactate dehydrogenase
MKIFTYNYRDDERRFYDKFCEEYNVELGICKDYPSLENAELTRGYEGVSVLVSDMNAQILQKFYDMGVRYITTRSVGFEHFDLEKAKELGLKISTVAYSPNTVANYAIMLMLMCCRKAKYILESSSVQDYSLTGKRGIELSDRTIGIIGTGKIGSTVIRHLSGFGCKLIAYDIFQSDEVKKYAEYVTLDMLLKTADIISFHVPPTEENHHLINEQSLKIMKDGVIIINTARGGLIDSDALIKGIESGKVGAAGLDVVEKEFGLYYVNLASQIINNRELAILKSFPNVIVTPHTAFYTDESISDMIENAIRGCCLFAEGKPNPFEVV